MHTMEVKQADAKEVSDDGPSVLGRFTWTVVGNTCIPCLLKNDDTKYVSVRIAESKVLGHFLHRLNVEVFNCVSVKSFGITEAENKLLNEINSRHCDYAFGRDPFSLDSDFIVKLDDLIEFYNFMDTCYNKLLSQTPSNNKNNKCGFVRINDDSVVPYAVKNEQKYVPLFYFEGETESLKTKAINLENWDLAYLKFCCKVQGIKNELFASEQCMVTSLEDVKSYFPEGTKFDDYWPSKVVEMQTPARSDINGNHSWVQTPHIDSSTVPQSVPNASHAIANKSIPSALTKQLHNNQRINTTAVISNISANVPVYQQGNSWPTTIMGNVNTVQSSTYQVPQQVNQPRLAQKQTPVTMHSINSNAAVTSRSYVNQAMRQHPPQYYSTAPVNVPNVPGATQPPPPLVRVSAANTVPNAYRNPISGDTYSSLYSNNSSLPALYSMTVPRHMNNTQTTQVLNKVRNAVPNQAANQNVTRFPPALTPINGTTNIIQTNTSATAVNNVSNNGNVMVANRQHRPNYNQTGGEIIDLSSPPHSPQHSNTNTINKISSVASNGFSYSKPNTNPILPALLYIHDQPPIVKNGIPPFKIQTVRLVNQSVQVINLRAYTDGDYVFPIQDIVTYFFPHVEINKLRHVLQTVIKVNLFQGTPAQIQLLREQHKGKLSDNDIPLMLIKDFEANHQTLKYLEHTMLPERDSIERDAKRQKIS